MKALFFLLLILLPLAGLAQIVNVKSIPLATGDQFNIYPAKNFGMAGLSIAIDDSLYDGFKNPAKGIFNHGINLFTIPSFYTITDNLGSARSFPLGFNYGNGKLFCGGAFSMQQLKGFEGNNSDIFDLDDSNTNIYLHGFFGKKLMNSGASVGLGVSWAKLRGMDGVDLLYANSDGVEQSGNVFDARLGLFKLFRENQQLELTGLYHYVEMRHDVSYRNWIWLEDEMRNMSVRDIVRNEDRSETFGFHLGYTHPLGTKGWRLGALATGNWKSHPKLPNYELQNIPRDPGDTDAYNFGIGISHKKSTTLFGFDAVYEPIWSHTWADAAEPVQTASGRTIEAGQVTVDNDFKFSNMLMRFGFKRINKKANFQFGIQMKVISYELDQYNYIDERQRDILEDWVEFTLAWGWEWRFDDFNFLYQGSMLAGAGRPGIANTFGLMSPAETSADYIVAPSGSLTMQEAFVFTNRFTFVIPLN